ncbi:two pore domain potassium channel family protein [Candidatus Berkelbacteria bacterium]|nr:two pore domain potassium channel family protein [Candidatus Berkelbacteria bacterium]
MVLLLLAGTVLFHQIEGWRWVDSFYFTGVSLLTIGYGDLTPTHDLSKILVVVLGFGAISTAFYAFSTLGRAINERVSKLSHQLPFTTPATGKPRERTTSNG